MEKERRSRDRYGRRSKHSRSMSGSRCKASRRSRSRSPANRSPHSSKNYESKREAKTENPREKLKRAIQEQLDKADKRRTQVSQEKVVDSKDQLKRNTKAAEETKQEPKKIGKRQDAASIDDQIRRANEMMLINDSSFQPRQFYSQGSRSAIPLNDIPLPGDN